MTAMDIRCHLEGAEALLDARRYEAALDVVREALTIEPESAEVHALACRALLGLGHHRDAVRAAAHAISLAPGWAYGHRLASIALVSEADALKARPSEQAVRAAQESVRLAPSNPYGYTALAEACAKVGRIDDADSAIRRGIALAPANASVWVSASFVALRAKNWLAAERAARHALAIDPNDYSATNNLGVALSHQGYWTLGAVAYLDAAHTDPRSPTARDNVEGIGFRCIAMLAPLALLPLLIVAPAFIAARIVVTEWLMKRPRRLKPLARRIGIRLAASKRRRRKFERHSARVERLTKDPQAKAAWTAVGRRYWASNGLLGFAGFGFAAFGLVSLALVISGSIPGEILGPSVFAATLLAAGAAALWRLAARRSHL